MAKVQTGVFSNDMITKMIVNGQLIAPDLPVENIQPASLDLRLGDTAYRVPASILPGYGVQISEMLDDFSMHQVRLTDGAVLERGCVYYVPLRESLALASDVWAIANAKSSTGRLDIFTRLITDHGVEFDRVPPGYHGPLYAEISPRSFSVLIRPDMRLNQIRFRRGEAILKDEELHHLHETVGLVDCDPHIADGLGFSVDLSGGNNDIVGYLAKPHTGLIDLDKIAHYPRTDFWEPICASNGRIILDPGAFYILVSREAVHVPPDYAAEMAPYMALVGEFRVHYAGFFDPGFGHAAAGGAGSRGVLEVRCHEAPFVLNHGQRVGRLIYEHMAARPSRLYGEDMKSNYQGQGLKLAKQFL